MACEELAFERIHLLRVALIEKDAEIALRGHHEKLVEVDHGTPEIAVAVERNSVRPRALAKVAGAEDFAIDEVAVPA